MPGCLKNATRILSTHREIISLLFLPFSRAGNWLYSGLRDSKWLNQGKIELTWLHSPYSTHDPNCIYKLGISMIFGASVFFTDFLQFLLRTFFLIQGLLPLLSKWLSLTATTSTIWLYPGIIQRLHHWYFSSPPILHQSSHALGFGTFFS